MLSRCTIPGCITKRRSYVEDITTVCVRARVRNDVWNTVPYGTVLVSPVRRHYGPPISAAVIITNEILNASAGYCLFGRVDKNFHANYRQLRPLFASCSLFARSTVCTSRHLSIARAKRACCFKQRYMLLT